MILLIRPRTMTGLMPHKPPAYPKSLSPYRIELPLRYESHADSAMCGSGRTLSIGSKAVRFAGNHDLRIGLSVRLVISWPARLEDGTPLFLSMLGRVEWTAIDEVEVAVSRHDVEEALRICRRAL